MNGFKKKSWQAALAVLCILLGAALYFLPLLYLRREVKNVALEMVESQTSLMAQSIVCQMEFGSNAALYSFDTSASTALLTEFMVQHPNVCGLFIVDKKSRIMSAMMNDDPGNMLANSATMQSIQRGAPEEIILEALLKENPTLRSCHVNVQDDHSSVGWIRLLVDERTLPMPLRVAVGRITSRMAWILLAILALLAVAGWVIYRQRNTARRLQAERDKAEQMAYVGTLAAGLAHEIRNPINALGMQLEMLDEDLESDDPRFIADRLQRIRGGLRGVERTVQDFLTFASPSRQQPAMIELEPFIGALCRQWEESSAPMVSGAPQPPVVCLIPAPLAAWCDQHALRQILSNLLSNAFKVQRDQPEVRVQITASRKGKWAEILVEDGGPGVNKDSFARIFDCFYTTSPNGTGLGLPIARRLAEMNLGTLELVGERSTLGGAAFVVRLLASPPEAGGPKKNII